MRPSFSNSGVNLGNEGTWKSTDLGHTVSGSTKTPLNVPRIFGPASRTSPGAHWSATRAPMLLLSPICLLSSPPLGNSQLHPRPSTEHDLLITIEARPTVMATRMQPPKKVRLACQRCRARRIKVSDCELLTSIAVGIDERELTMTTSVRWPSPCLHQLHQSRRSLSGR